jgi:hypothetical protein
MQDSMLLVMRISILCLVLLVGYSEIIRGRPRRYFLTAALAVTGLLVFGLTGSSPSGIETKGTAEDLLGITLGFVTTVLGMISEYFYRQVERGRRRFRFDVVSFVAPILVSPIVFIPLFTMFADIDFAGPFTKAKFMIYLVAFQNGFFWRSFFEERMKKPVTA